MNAKKASKQSNIDDLEKVPEEFQDAEFHQEIASHLLADENFAEQMCSLNIQHLETMLPSVNKSEAEYKTNTNSTKIFCTKMNATTELEKSKIDDIENMPLELQAVESQQDLATPSLTNISKINNDENLAAAIKSTDSLEYEKIKFTQNEIDNYTKAFKDRDIVDIKELLGNVEKLIESESSNMKAIERKSRSFISDFKKSINEQKAELEELIQHVENEFPRTYKNTIEFYNERIIALKTLEKTLASHLQDLQSIYCFPGESFMALYNSLKAIQEQLDETIKVILHEIPDIEILSHKSVNIPGTKLSSVSMENMEEVREFCATCTNIFDKLSIHLSNKGTAQIVREMLPLVYCRIAFVTSVKRSTINAVGDTFGATYLPDNTIMISDRDKDQVIKLDENLNVLEKFPVAGKPYGLCVSTDRKLLHAVCNDNAVVSYALQGDWIEVSRFKTEDRARGIACHGDKIVTGHDWCVVIHDSTGKQVDKIRKAAWSVYVTFSNDGSLLYHREGYTVVARKMDDLTQVVWSHSLEESEVPYGIDTDRDGNILIVGDKSNIYQVAPDGKLERILVRKLQSITYPSALFCNKQNDKIGISSLWPNETCLEIYKFQL